ncbi:uncharacterized protein LOC8081211 [Sorghum bicolor]|jgi:hypothetical protein|uniref:Uncharacterized protein n=1 Tax=Sorghum bicolor TaxID=4558 RepID=C5WW61_SORBI|nr:uncharacterized protein LOC8081211 [Sorghum bicolor]EER93249.1 hypothetical protein SORBI_3001G047700 [Sorghum bicolor]|eukprot:XP_002466251.1 uncharacterized protein LOC8081211 [Sorghum bicolor]
MTVRPGWVVWVARGSAAAWQRVACNPETLPPDRVLALICCAPLHLLARLAAFLCVPFLPGPARRAPLHLRRGRRFLVLRPPELLPQPFAYSSSSSSSSSSDEEEDDDGDDIHQHVD